MTTTSDKIKTAIEDGVAVVALNRAKAMNSFDAEMLAALIEELERLDADRAVRAIVLHGSEKFFSAGMDLKYMSEAESPAAGGGDFLAAWDRLRALKTPLVAAVRGFALGGGFELALACDIIVCAEDAKLGLPEITLGLIPGAGGTQRLTHAIGKARAMRLILTGGRLSGVEAGALGVAAEVVPADRVLDAAKELAAKIAKQAPLAAVAAKAAVQEALDRDLREGMTFERDRFFEVFDSADGKEGVRAFLDKRAPEFKGR